MTHEPYGYADLALCGLAVAMAYAFGVLCGLALDVWSPVWGELLPYLQAWLLDFLTEMFKTPRYTIS